MLNNRRFTLFICSLALIVLFGTARPTFAVTTLKQVQVSNGSQVDLLFDGQVGKQQVQTEFFNDIIQISLTDTSVYPAKISSVSGSNLLKVFAYQYSPKLVRCRFTVKGKAEDYKDRFQFSLNGKLLTVRLTEGEMASDRINLGAAHADRVVPGSAGDNSPAAKLPVSAEESSLMQRVLASNPALDAKEAPKDIAKEHAKEPTKEPVKELAKEPAKISKEPAKEVASAGTVEKPAEPLTGPVKGADSEGKMRKPLGGLKPLPSPLGVLGKLALVLGLFGVLAVAVRKFRGDGRQNSSILNAIGTFAKSGIGRQLGKKEKMIEVLTTHYLGPKKSIAVVRVFGRVLVLAVANESISLITQLPDAGGDGLSGMEDLDLEQLGIPSSIGSGSTGLGAVAAGPAIFADLLNKENSRPAPASGATRAAAGAYSSQFGAGAQAAARPQFVAGSPSITIGAARAGDQGVRAQIRSRLEGLKQL